MKLIKGLLSLVCLGALITLYTGCDSGDPEKSEEQQQLESLASTWSIATATNAGVDRTADFPGLVLTITGSFTSDGGTYQYSFTGTRPNPSPWQESGTWKFGQDPKQDIIRDPGTDLEIPMTYTLSGDQLNVEFVVPEGYECCPGSGRIASVEGTWSFTFAKQ